MILTDNANGPGGRMVNSSRNVSLKIDTNYKLYCRQLIDCRHGYVPALHPVLDSFLADDLTVERSKGGISRNGLEGGCVDSDEEKSIRKICKCHY